VALEALTNAAKHAPDATVTVRLDADDEWITLEVSDDGPGWTGPEPVAGSGITNMLDRIGAVGGSFDMCSAPGQGTRIEAVVPLAKPTAEDRAATGSRLTLAGISALRRPGD